MRAWFPNAYCTQRVTPRPMTTPSFNTRRNDGSMRQHSSPRNVHMLAAFVTKWLLNHLALDSTATKRRRTPVSDVQDINQHKEDWVDAESHQVAHPLCYTLAMTPLGGIDPPSTLI
eukprot:2344049-Amphidinium_carterae.2